MPPGRGGKRTRPQIRAKGEDEEGHQLTLAPSTKYGDKPPDKYPPIPNSPRPFPDLSPSDQSYIETSLHLSQSFHYSGYYLTSPPTQSITLHRYSDRYRRLQGKRTFSDECEKPSPYLFPPELYRGLGKRKGGGGGVQPQLFLSSAALQREVERLTEVGEKEGEGGGGGVGGGVKEERKERGREGEDEEDRKGKKDEDEDEDEEEEEKEEDDDDDMGGGDYTDRYQEDDDGEGGDDVFGEDDGDIM